MSATAATSADVLVVGVYLGDRPNTIEHLVEAFRSSLDWTVTQQWMALGPVSENVDVAAVTVGSVANRVPKYVLLNRMLAEVSLARYAYILVSDDDIVVPATFIDNYLALVGRHDFALAQPARTHDSFIDHPFVEQLAGLRARRTNFVEIGPLFSMRRDATRVLLPFDEDSPMGWGYDLVWPAVMSDAGLKLGIVDATPVAHNLRRSVAEYAWVQADRQRRDHLAKHPHLRPDEAFFIIDSYA